ncbi:MAG: mechanosensitive ion channel family protein [Bacteroidetes bacterium]|nr:MAG: mechanosensitive ion channel family protein [Bacteroidota bacterium]
MLNNFQQALAKLAEKLQNWLEGLVLALPNLLLAVLVLVVAIFLSRYLKRIANRALERVIPNKTVTGLVANFIVVLFMVLALFVVLSILQLDKALVGLLSTAGIAGLAVGLALQDPMVNLFSGVLMSMREFYRVGDLVETNGFFGKIKHINLRSTILERLDGQEVVIPNKTVVQNPLINFSHSHMRRVEVNCGVAYGDDLEKVQSVVLEAIRNSTINPEKSRPMEVFFTEFGDSSINFTLRFWKRMTQQAEYLDARSKAIVAIKKAFDENGITIPFPIRTLDFGVVGGLPIHEIYTPASLGIGSKGRGGASLEKSNSNSESAAKSPIPPRN